MATETSLDSIIPDIWQIQEKTETITADNYARLVSEYRPSNPHIGDTIHIPIMPTLSIADWSVADLLGTNSDLLGTKKKPLIVIMVDK